MKEEYNYYSKSKVQDLMWKNEMYNTYYDYIRNAFVKQTSPNAYKTLRSNLYDVWDYAIHYYTEVFKK